MKNYLFKLSVLLSFLLPFSTLAVQDVTLTTDLIINAGGINITLAGNIDSDGLTVNADDFTLTLSNNSSVTLISTDKRTMTFSQPAGANQLTTSFVCSSSDSRYTILNPTAGATGLQITVTPTLTTCAAGGGSGGGSGGGGGGGGSSSAAAPAATPAAPATPAQPAIAKATPATPVTPAKPALTSVPASPVALVAVSINRPLSLGQRSSDVRRLQEALSQDKNIYPEGLKTGYFGPATKRAVERFQEKYGIATKGVVGYGNFGPKTRAKFNEVYGAKSSAPAVPSSATTATTATTAIPSPVAQPKTNTSATLSTLLNTLKSLQAELSALKAKSALAPVLAPVPTPAKPAAPSSVDLLKQLQDLQNQYKKIQ